MGEYQLEKSNQLAKELETLRYELEPLEEVCTLLFPYFIPTQFISFLEKNGTGQEGRTSHEYDDLGGSGTHVCAVWHIGTSHLVGILLGYYGTSNLFCYLRHHNGHVRLLLCDEAGELADRYNL